MRLSGKKWNARNIPLTHAKHVLPGRGGPKRALRRKLQYPAPSRVYPLDDPVGQLGQARLRSNLPKGAMASIVGMVWTVVGNSLRANLL